MLTKTLPKVCQTIARAPSGRTFASTAAAAPIRATGYNFTLNEQEREIIDLAERFTREEIIPRAPHHDRTGEFPWDIVKKAHSLGLMNLHVPKGIIHKSCHQNFCIFAPLPLSAFQLPTDLGTIINSLSPLSKSFRASPSFSQCGRHLWMVLQNMEEWRSALPSAVSWLRRLPTAAPEFLLP